MAEPSKRLTSTNSLGSFPDPLATKEVKADPSWGLQFANAMYSDYSKNITLYNTKRANDMVNRKYREGLQSIQSAKNRLDINGDNSYVNLDFSPINRIASIVDNIKGKLMNMPIKIQCNPIEPEAQSRFDDYKKELYANMYLQNNASDVAQATGIPFAPKNKYIPKTMDEANLHLASFRLDESIAMEQAIEWVNKENIFEHSRSEIIEDLITIKKAALYRYYDENNNIRHERIDPIDVLTPYSKYDDFRNITYIGVIKQYQLWEIAQMNPEFTDEDLWHIAYSNQGKNANTVWSWGQSYEGYYTSNTGIRPYFSFNISVLEFYTITQNTEVREKKKNSKGGYFYNRKSENYKGENTEGKEYTYKKCAYTYGGKFVVGTKYIWDWKMLPNQEREKFPDGSYSPKAELPISMIAPGIYDMENKSIVERLRTFEDLWNLAHLKFQQLLIKAVPPGIAFDVSGLDGIILNTGQAATPLEVLRMYLQTGSFPFSSVGKDDRVVNNKIVEQLPNGIGKDFEAYIETQQHYMQMMNDVIGFNSAVDGSTPNSDSLVGVQKMAAQATQNALRPLYTSHAELILKSTKRVALMIQDCLEHNYDAFVSAIGTEAASVLKYGKKLPLSCFGLELELLPDDEEKAQVEQLLQIGLQNGSLFPSDVIRIRQELKSDTKKAAQLLVLLEDKNKKDKDASQAAIQQQQGQVQQQAIQAATQAKQVEMQLEVQTKTKLLQAEYQIKDAFEQKQHERAMELQAAKNIGIENVAQINAGKAVDVQSISTHGKLLEAKDNNDTKLERENIIHNSKIHHAAFQNAIEPTEAKIEK